MYKHKRSQDGCECDVSENRSSIDNNHNGEEIDQNDEKEREETQTEEEDKILALCQDAKKEATVSMNYHESLCLFYKAKNMILESYQKQKVVEEDPNNFQINRRKRRTTKKRLMLMMRTI